MGGGTPVDGSIYIFYLNIDTNYTKKIGGSAWFFPYLFNVKVFDIIWKELIENGRYLILISNIFY